MLSILLTTLSWAELPMPAFEDCGETDQPDLCPNDLRERWTLISYIPSVARESVREAELTFGSGNRIDKAWRYGAGRFDVKISIMDSGIDWGSNDIKKKFYLHAPELPIPQLSDGSEASGYDANGDGVFNIDDYSEDPRVDQNAGPFTGEDELDVSDLIYTFSDGIDDDGNGYVDDISGWDFFGRDNDAFHIYNEGYGTHGNGVAREAAAEGNNDRDRIGVCPNCAIVPIRVGDTFVTDGGRAAEAIVYATDIGSASVTMAIGALSNSEATEDAARYAFESGTLLVGAAGDENSYHHNFPAVLDDVVYVHSLTHNTGDDDAEVYSYMNTWNCNNYGARMTLSAASTACATGAVAQTAGAIGLIKSIGLDNGIDLTAGENYQLLINNITDINLSEDERSISKAYPSHEGWDPFYGYGRLNVEAAVAAVVEGRIPPSVSISYPEWFEVIVPDSTPVVDIEATVNASRTGAFTWTLEVGYGHDPSFTIVDSGTGGSTFSGVLTTLDVSALPEISIPEAEYDETIRERLARVNEPAVTVRLRVEDSNGVLAEQRKTFFVHQDSSLFAGFPFRLNGSGEASPVLYDMDGDQDFEIIVADGGGFVHVVDSSGQELPGWPQMTNEAPGLSTVGGFSSLKPVRDVIVGSPAAGDLDGDGVNEVVATGVYGGVYAWHADGTSVAGFPVQSLGRSPEEFDTDHTYDQGFMGAPTLYDIDSNGSLEIISVGLDSRLYVWKNNGDNYDGYPIAFCAPELCGVKGFRAITSVTVGDADNDGAVEFAFGTNEAVNNESDSVSYLYDAITAQLEPNWPLAVRGLVGEAVLLPQVGEGHPASLAMADIDNDGDYELANPVMLGTNSPVHHDGTDAMALDFYATGFSESSNADVPSLVQMVSNPSWGDLDLDGVPDYVISGVSSIYLVSLAARYEMNFQQGIGAWSGSTGSMFEGWPRQIEDVQFLTAPAIADVSGDGVPEVIMPSGGYLMHAWDKNGIEAGGFPKFTGQWILASPAVGDIDGDKYIDVAVTTREGWLYAWGTKGDAGQDVQWSAIHHDAQNTGNYHHPLPQQEGLPNAVSNPEEGCCKRNDKDQQAALVFPLLLVLGWRRRHHK
ncbi:MAG: FG-GAP-like repeat-containing protein [Myxococcota bacterium]